MISPHEIRKLAELARIKLVESEEQGLAQDMENILGYVEQIKDVSGSLKESKEKNRNVLREDIDPHDSGMHTELLLKEAPQIEDEYIKVKKILS